MIYAGVDGCRAGWFAAIIYANGQLEAALFKDIRKLWLELKGAELILIDVPIGLREAGPAERTCDGEARVLLGRPRSSSVFPAPCRPAVYEDTYEAALQVNRELTGKGLSVQSYYISRKIREVDVFLAEEPAARAKIRETHPEVCFRAFAGVPMKYHKNTKAGFSERTRVISAPFPGAGRLIRETLRRYARRDVSPDDLLDALAAALTAARGTDGLLSIPPEPEPDARGLPMEIVYRQIKGPA